MKLFYLLPVILLSACTLPPRDYVEFEDYYHIKKEEIVCKPIKVEEQPVYRSTDISVKTTSKCMFIKVEVVFKNPSEIAQRKRLEDMLNNSTDK